MSIARLYNFTPGTPIVSAQVDAEFDQLVAALNGNSSDVDVTITLSHAVNPPLTLNQTSSGPILNAQKSGTTVAKINNDGTISVAVNAAASAFVKLGGTYQQNITTVGNVGAGEDDLHSYTIAANVFAANGDTLEIEGAGHIQSAGNNKTVSFYVDAQQIFTVTVDPSITKQWCTRITVQRFSSTELVTTFLFFDDLLTSVLGKVVQTSAHDFTTPIIIKWTGEDADGTSDRVNQYMSYVRKFYGV